MKKESILNKKSYLFSLEIIKLYDQLISNKNFDIGRQILRSGTSIGANLAEASAAFSKNDFLHKLTISHKEAEETRYWLFLLRDSKKINRELSEKLIFECSELIKILTKSIKTLRKL